MILATAFVLRFVGIFYGYPLILAGDETPTLLASLKMIGTHSLRAATPGYYYPALLSYIYLPFLVIFLGFGRLFGLFSDIKAMQEAVFFNLGIFIPVVRFVSVFLGTLSVYLSYKITRLLFNDKKTGLLAAFFVTISYFNVSNAHFAQTWTAQTFFILLALYFAIKFYKKDNPGAKDYIFGGLIVGVAFGINFVGILSYFWFVLAHFLRNKKDGFVKIFIKNKSFWLMNLFLLLTMILVYYLNPYGLNNYLSRIMYPSADAAVGIGNSSYKPFSFSFLKVLWFYIKNTVIQEPVFFALALAGSVFLWLRNKIIFYFLVLWAILYYLMISPLTGAMGRYILPVVPLMAIITAGFIQARFSGFLNKKIVWICLIIISIYSIYFSILFDIRMLKQDTRVLARNWILENIPSGSIIKNEYFGESLYLIEDKRGINLIKDNRPELFSTKRKYLLSLSDKDYPKSNYFISGLSDISRLVPKFDYVILAGFDKNDLSKQAEDLPKNAELIKVFYPVKIKDNLLLQPSFKKLQFTPDNSQFRPWFLFEQVDYNGPYIEIYKLR